jgi:hypothetical protein
MFEWFAERFREVAVMRVAELWTQSWGGFRHKARLGLFLRVMASALIAYALDHPHSDERRPVVEGDDRLFGGHHWRCDLRRRRRRSGWP